MGKFMVFVYEKLYKKTAPDYVAGYSVGEVLFKPIRKILANNIAANCPFNGMRICLYRRCGFKIGKHVSIGMKCFMDDHCPDLIEIGDHVTISYGVYFACHGANQPHAPIVIRDGAYIGMRASIISKNRDVVKNGVVIGKEAVVGACALVNCDVPDGATAVGIPCRILKRESD